MAAVRAGDDRAFEELYHRYQRRIGAYIYGMVHDHGRAEDITQDVFMSALRRMRETETPIAFKPWIYEIAKNACIDAFRRSKRAEEISYDADDGSERLHLVSKGPTPEAAVDTRMSLDNLRGAFGGLSEAHHQILVMRELEGLTYREIGERLGMSRPSVESTLFRARRRLSEEYEELVTGERCRRIQSIIAGATGGRVGTRDERKMARHVSYCQPCRRAAFAAGFDADALDPAPHRCARRSPRCCRCRRSSSAALAGKGGGDDTLAERSRRPRRHAGTALDGCRQLRRPGHAGWGKAAAAAAAVAARRRRRWSGRSRDRPARRPARRARCAGRAPGHAGALGDTLTHALGLGHRHATTRGAARRGLLGRRARHDRSARARARRVARARRRRPATIR